MKRDKRSDAPTAATTPLDPTDPALQRLIAERAYQLYQMRGGAHGHDLDDWLAAEREIMATTTRVPAKNRTTRTTKRPAGSAAPERRPPQP